MIPTNKFVVAILYYIIDLFPTILEEDIVVVGATVNDDGDVDDPATAKLT